MRERRSIKTPRPIQIRAKADGGKVLEGYGAVFYSASDPGTEYQLWSDLYERIKPSAFDRALREQQDVRGLFNHDTNWLLGRSVSQTMRLSVDAVGLRYEIDLPDTQQARDIAVLAERGDLNGSSFSFIPRRVTYVRGESVDIREIDDVDLFDVGPVTFPAYEATTAGLRSADAEALRREYEAWRAQQRSNPDADNVAVRLALLGL